MAVHGKNTSVKVDNAAGVLTDLSSIGKDSGLQRSINTADASHYGTTAKEYVAGQSDATFSISGLWSATADAMLNDVYEATVAGTIDSTTVEYGPAGNTTGKPKYTQECIMTGYDVTGSVGDLVQATVSFQRTGETTRGTFA